MDNIKCWWGCKATATLVVSGNAKSDRATAESNLGVSCKVKYTRIRRPNNITPKRNKIHHKDITNIYSSFIHIGQNRKESKYPSLVNG